MTAVDREIAIIVLRDGEGRVLMQHRDAEAPVYPLRWTPPGGRIEPGETPIEAAHRELAEEAGLGAELATAGAVELRSEDGAWVRYHVFTGSTDARQDDVVLGEGLAMVFTPPAEALDLPLTPIARRLLAPT